MAEAAAVVAAAGVGSERSLSMAAVFHGGGGAAGGARGEGTGGSRRTCCSGQGGCTKRCDTRRCGGGGGAVSHLQLQLREVHCVPMGGALSWAAAVAAAGGAGGVAHAAVLRAAGGVEWQKKEKRKERVRGSRAPLVPLRDTRLGQAGHKGDAAPPSSTAQPRTTGSQAHAASPVTVVLLGWGGKERTNEKEIKNNRSCCRSGAPVGPQTVDQACARGSSR